VEVKKMKMEMNNKEWMEWVKSSNKKRGKSKRSKELVSDLKLFVIMLVFWVGFVSVVEVLGL